MRFFLNIQQFRAQVSSIECESFKLLFVLDTQLGIILISIVQLYKNVLFEQNNLYLYNKSLYLHETIYICT